MFLKSFRDTKKRKRLCSANIWASVWPRKKCGQSHSEQGNAVCSIVVMIIDDVDHDDQEDYDNGDHDD